MNKSLDVIILAAGKGTRLKSQRPKVLHPLFGQTLIQRVLGSLVEVSQSASIRRITVVVGHGRDEVKHHLTALEDLESFSCPAVIDTVVQEPQQGTGHAVMQVKAHWEKTGQGSDIGDVLILSGDAPLLRAETLAQLVSRHKSSNHDLTFLGATLDNPKGYGRLLVETDSVGQERVLGIVEDKDTTPVQQAIQTVNAGIYCARWQTIAPLLDQISSGNAQGEFYFTDTVELAEKAGLRLGLSLLSDPQEMLGVNDRQDLGLCHRVLNQRTCERLMVDGVTILDPASVLIAPEVEIGADSVVHSGTYLTGIQHYGAHCTLGPNITVNGPVTVGEHVAILHSVLAGPVAIGDHATVGPYAHVRHDVTLDHHVAIGNFVEVKMAKVGAYTNAKHLAYIGNATLGEEVNLGGGAVIANYDPVRDAKHHTVLEDGVKVGCNSVLISPVNLKERSSVAAGSVITKDVSPWSLAVARGRQVELKDWVMKTLQKKKRNTSESSEAGQETPAV